MESTIYNSFVLKVLHAKAQSLDELVTRYLPLLSKHRDDAMHRFFCFSRHATRLVREIEWIDRLNRKERWPLDLYFVNFDLCLARLASFYVRADDTISTPATLFPWEQAIKQYAMLQKQEGLIELLVLRYMKHFCFNYGEKTSTDNGRRKRRVVSFYNTKRFVELDDTIESALCSSGEEMLLYYDHAASMGLLYLYMVSALTEEARQYYNKRSINSLKQTQSPLLEENLNSERDASLVFLCELRERLKDMLVGHLLAWCIKDRSEANEAELHSHYFDMETPSAAEPLFTDEQYRQFLGYTRAIVELPKKQFLSMLQPHSAFYESITYVMLFHMQLERRHKGISCGGADAVPCLPCRYRHVCYKVPELLRVCTQYSYNQVHNDNLEQKNRMALDHLLGYTMIAPLLHYEGLLFQLLYKLQMWHLVPCGRMPVAPRYWLEMIDLQRFVDDVMTKRHSPEELERNTRAIFDLYGVGNQPPEEAQETAFTMELIIKVIGAFDKQQDVVDKYERQTDAKLIKLGAITKLADAKLTDAKQATLHSEIRNTLKALYIYLGQQLTHNLTKTFTHVS